MSHLSLRGAVRSSLVLLLMCEFTLHGPSAVAGAMPQQPDETTGKSVKNRDDTVRISTPRGTIILRRGDLLWPRAGGNLRRPTRVSGSATLVGPDGSLADAAGVPTGGMNSPRLHAGAGRIASVFRGTALGEASPADRGAAISFSHPSRGRVALPDDTQLPDGGGSSNRGGGGSGNGAGIGDSPGDGPGNAVGGDNANEWRTGRGLVPGGEGDDTGAYLSDGAFFVLEPGNGWGGPTSQPDPVGSDSMAGWDAQVIARWDVVPFQTIDNEFYIGVVAFHANGIDRVEFSVDGGPWVPVYTMQLNPDTGVWEYAAVLSPQYFDSGGPCEVRAIVWPKDAGIPRLLAGDITTESLAIGEHSMFLRVPGMGERLTEFYVSTTGNDQTGTGSPAKPFRSIEAAISASSANARIGVFLTPGTYPFGADESLPSLDDGWVVIQPAPGVSRDKVILTGRYPDQLSGNRLRTRNICLRSLTIDQREGWQIGAFSNLDGRFWADRCEFIGAGDAVNCAPFAWQNWSGMFITDCEVREYANAVRGANLVRNTRLEQIGSDAFSDSRAVFNSSVVGVTRGDGTMHGDVFQIQGVGLTKENFVLYGVSAYDVRVQGLFTSSLEQLNDVAFVNVLLDRDVWDDYTELSAPYSQWMSPTNHLLLWNTTILNQSFRFRDHEMRNLSVRGSMFQKVVAEDGIDLESQGEWEHMHYLDATSYGAQSPGEDVTAGLIRFENVAQNLLRPLPGQRLEGRVSPNSAPIDLEGQARPATSSIGAFEIEEITR